MDVGCGVGVSPILLAKRIGCRVVGVDISEGMVRRSRKFVKKVKKEGIAPKNLSEYFGYGLYVGRK